MNAEASRHADQEHHRAAAQRCARTMHGLGLRGPGSSVVVSNTPSFRGAIKKVHSPRARRRGGPWLIP